MISYSTCSGIKISFLFQHRGELSRRGVVGRVDIMMMNMGGTENVSEVHMLHSPVKWLFSFQPP